MTDQPHQLSLFGAGEDPFVALRGHDVTVAEVLPVYVRYLTGARKAEQTVASFSSDIRQLAAFYPRLPVTRLSTPHLLNFLGYLQQERHLKDKTITRKTTALKNFCAFLCAAALIPSNPALPLIYPTLHPPLPEILTDDEISRLLQISEEKPLWHALLATLRYTGAKRQEALALRREDVTLELPAPTIALRKRRPSRYGRDRVVPLNEPLRGILVQYLSNLEGPYLFPLHVRSIKWGISHFAQLTGIARPISAETLRDTFAVAWMRQRLPGEQELANLDLGDALMAVREKHDRDLVTLLGLAENTRHADEAIQSYRILAEAAMKRDR